MPSPSEPILDLRNLGKTYPGVKALSDMTWQLRPGEVHALVGENGAGKSTLGRMICGITPPSQGQMFLLGQPYGPSCRKDAQRHGVCMVMQELNLVGTLTVAENICLDHMPSWLGLINYRAMNQGARQSLAALGLTDIDPASPVSRLGVGQQQMVEIASVLSRQCRVLILDEPTAALTGRETEQLFQQIARLKAEGVAIIYISHRMEEIKRIADRITILRDGKWIATHPAADIAIDQVIKLMVGRELDQAASHRTNFGPVAMRVDRLCRGNTVRNVSFAVQGGEILGFAGLMGSGRTETMRAIFAADRPEGGAIYLHGSAQPARIRTPRDAVRQGIALLTEDRKHQGLLLPLPIRDNITLPRMGNISRLGGWISPTAERATARHYSHTLGVRCRDIGQPVGQLSGGNQQKVIIAKWIYRNCDILIFDEPTRGIDIGAKFEIYQLLAKLAEEGKAIIVVSSDLPELMAIADRIAVMSAGAIAATFPRGQWTQDSIMTAALSGYMKG